ncbi:MAG: hypothetical protein A4E66_02511 [Syntrophus sp. PtaB.Bin001]|nr:MAG: hypothetical protein A4E66_02511 [Syntrophus sp. PtaB.Bin001]
MDNIIDAIYGITMFCRPGRFHAAALINGYIDYHAARFHCSHKLAANQFRSFCPGNQDTAYYTVCMSDGIGNIEQI